MMVVVIMDFSRFIIVMVSDIGKIIWSVFSESGIFGSRNIGRLFGRFFLFFMVGIFMLK